MGSRWWGKGREGEGKGEMRLEVGEGREPGMRECEPVWGRLCRCTAQVLKKRSEGPLVPSCGLPDSVSSRFSTYSCGFAFGFPGSTLFVSTCFNVFLFHSDSNYVRY